MTTFTQFRFENTRFDCDHSATPICRIQSAENRRDRTQSNYSQNMAKCSEHGIRLSCVSTEHFLTMREDARSQGLFSPFSDEPSLPEQQQHQSYLALQRSGRVSG